MLSSKRSGLRTLLIYDESLNYHDKSEILIIYFPIVEDITMNGHFNTLLKKHFKDKNLSELSRLLDIPRSLLQDWIHEGREPSMKNIDHVKKIAEHIGATLEELLTGGSTTRVLSSVVFEDGDKKYQILINRIK
jgi:hypothetical protein